MDIPSTIVKTIIVYNALVDTFPDGCDEFEAFESIASACTKPGNTGPQRAAPMSDEVREKLVRNVSLSGRTS